LDDVVERALDPRLQRHGSSCVACRRSLSLVARLTVKRRRRRERERVADHPRQPFVVLVFQWRLARFDQAEVGGHELGHAPARRISAHQRVEIILELTDLVDVHSSAASRTRQGRAGAIIVERRRLAPQRDLLDR